MSSIVSIDVGRERRARTAAPSPVINVALLGCGTVGSAFAALTAQPFGEQPPVRLTAALVRDARRTRPSLPGDVLRTADTAGIFSTTPDVVVELLGGLEPARTLVTEALLRGIPVVTANKSLLAAHGRELHDLASHSGTPLLYEAAVLAGVPFLGTFSRRAYASQLSGVVGIANGTSNYVLTRSAAGKCGIRESLEAAQHLGLAEPDPSNDVDGVDAAEKLAVLLQHFAHADVHPATIETCGIRAIDADDLADANRLGGTIKPVICADWSNALTAFVGPAFVPATHPLASVDDADNALIFTGPRGRLLFQGPGAGPEVTAATVLDDVHEAVGRGCGSVAREWTSPEPAGGETGWLITISSNGDLPRGAEIADLLAAHGIFLQRTGVRDSRFGGERFAALTWPASRPRVQRALAALSSAAGCQATQIRALEAGR